MARTTKGYEIKYAARRSHLSLGDGEWAEIYYEGLTGIDAARKGRRITKFISATKVPTTGPLVSTKAALYFTLGSTTASRVMVGDVLYGCRSVSDSVQVEVGYTTAASGAGTFTALTPKFGFHVGTAQVGEEQAIHKFRPPLAVRYTADGARSVTLRITTNDTSCEVNAGWDAWYETE